MVKKTFTQWLRLCVILVIAGVTYSSNLQAQSCPAISTNDQVQISLNSDCEVELTPDMLLEGDPTTMGSDFFITIDALGIDREMLNYTLSMEIGTYNYTIENECGNSQWGRLVVEDNIPPSVDGTLLCPVGTPCTYSCAEEAWLVNNSDYTAGLNPTFTDNCGNVGNVQFRDLVTGTEVCSNKTVTRTWFTTTESHGELTQIVLAVQEFLLEPVELDDIICPTGELSIPCGEGTSPADIAAYFDDPDTDGHEGYQYGYPTYEKPSGEPVPVENSLCNIVAGFTDTPLNSCGEGTEAKTILRTWTVIDWCDGSNKPCVQKINVGGDGPSITLNGDLNVSTDPWLCAANVEVPAPEHLTDACKGDLTYTVQLDELLTATIHGNASTGYTILGVPKGTYTLTYIGKNQCGDEARASVQLTVGDYTPPVAIANEHLVISLTSGASDASGVAKLFANSVDKGSYDACTDVHLEVRRDSDNCGFVGNDTYNDGDHPHDLNSPTENDEDDGLYVKFCCSDLDQVDDNGVSYGLVKVWLRVWDDGDLDGTFGSAGDNYNETWAWVRVEDKLPAQIVCPPDVVVECNSDLGDLTATGTAVASGNCGSLSVNYKDSGDLSSCGLGQIVRTWFIDNDQDGNPDNGIACQQVITVEAREPFDPTEIKWPPHYKDRAFEGVTISANGTVTEGNIDMPGSVNCADDALLCEPEWNDGECVVVGKSVKTDTFFFEAGSCMTIIKHWTVIDWCTYAPNDDPNDGPFNDRDDDNDSGCEQFEAVDDALIDSESCFAGQNLYFRYKKDISLVEEGIDVLNDIFGLSGSSTIQDIRNVINDILSAGCLLSNYPMTILLDNGQTIPVPPTATISDLLAAIAASGANVADLIIDGMVDVDGYYTFDQVISITDDQRPVLDQTKKFELSTDGNSCAAELVVKMTATDEGNCPSAWLKWEVNITDRNWNPIASASGQGANGSMFTYDVSADLGRLFSDGFYNASWRISDGCGNYSTFTQMYIVADTKAPTPYCISDLGTTVMEEAGYVEIWASDYDRGATDNCTSKDDLVFSFSGTEFKPSLRVTCLDGGGDLEIENGVSQVFNDIKVWVWDLGSDKNCDGQITQDERNKDYCTVTLRVQDNVGVCNDEAGGEDRSRIAGNINTIAGEAVVDAEVSLSTNMPEYPITRMSNDNGSYAFSNLPMHNNYELTAKRDDVHNNGVSTLDLVMIQRHILGIKDLGSPYKIIAADANSDHKITAADLVQIRKVILGIYTEFPSNEAWRFVDASQTFVDANRPFPFAETILLNHLNTDMNQENFVAVKIGDVNDNAKSNNAVDTEVRNNITTSFVIDEQSVSQDELIVVPVYVENVDLVHGTQFSMDYTGLVLEGIQEGALAIENANYIIQDGKVSLSWASATGVEIEDALFNLVFKATEGGVLSEKIALNSSLSAEIYTGQNTQTSAIDLEFRNVSTDLDGGFELYQNQPNPFNGSTEISFSLPQSGAATMTIYEATGKVLYTVTGNFSAGHNTVTIHEDDLNQTGILYYQLSAGEQLSTKKMIVIE